MRDKDLTPMIQALATAQATVFPITLQTERAYPAAVLVNRLVQAGLTVAGPGTVPDGLAWFQGWACPDEALLITGSHLVVGQLPDEILPLSDQI